MSLPPPPGPARVLVVDDDVDLAENIAELFADPDRVVSIANSPTQALERARVTGFDLAIVDLSLPESSGVVLAERLRATCPDAEVIFVTAKASVDTAVAAVRQGALAYVQKPFAPEELLALGARALDQVALRSERARLQEELERSEALYRSVVDAVDAFIIGLDDRGRVRMWNRAAARSTGREASEVLGRPLAALLASPVSVGPLKQAIDHAVHGLSVFDVELPVRASDGSDRVVAWRFSPLEPGSSLDAVVVAVGTDMTARRELERRTAEAEAMASIATLTAGLAHEIRNPLNAATLQLELLGRGVNKLEDSELAKSLGQRAHLVREELGRLKNLLDDFLDLARPRALTLDAVDLGVLVHEVADLEQPFASEAGVAIECAPETCGLHALGDASMLKQALVNLVLNAIEALRPQGGGHVNLSCTGIGETRVELLVEDDGPGIAPDVAERMFTPFVTTKEAGTGLGLTIVKRVVDRHGGTIRVTNGERGGAAVRIHLDRAEGTK